MQPTTYSTELAIGHRFLLPVSATRIASALDAIRVLEAVDESDVLLLVQAPGPHDDRVTPYQPDGVTALPARCLPVFALLIGGGLEGNVPAIRFERRDDKVVLAATLIEQRAARPAGLLPVAVTIDAVKLWGPEGTQVKFTAVIADLDDSVGPSMQLRIEAELDNVNDGLVAPGTTTVDNAMRLLQNPGTVIGVEYSFRWRLLTVTPGTTQPAEPPEVIVLPPHVPRPRLPRFDRLPARFDVAPLDVATPIAPDRVVEAPVAHRRLAVDPAVLDRALIARGVLERVGFRPRRPGGGTTTSPPTVTRGELTTYRRTSNVAADFPLSNPANRFIYAQVTGAFEDTQGWRRAASGWWKPAGGDNAYLVADEYRLAFDATTGLPAITSILTPGAVGGGAPAPDRARVALRVVPYFDPVRLDALRSELRTISGGVTKHATLVPGGYKGARFEAEDSRALLVDVFTGASATEALTVNPEVGFTVSFEGTTEFIQLLYERLKGPGLRDWVELDLEDSGGTVVKQRLPVKLAMTSLAPLPLQQGVLPPGEGGGPWTLSLTNPTPLAVTIAAFQARALRREISTDRVASSWPATWDHVTLPLALPPGQATTVELRADAPDDQRDLIDGWEVELVGARPDLALEVMLDHVFATGTGVRGWTIHVIGSPFQYWDRLTEEDRAALAPVVMVEVELRRTGDAAAAKLVLSREQPAGDATLARTVADFVRRDVDATFEYRLRTVMVRSFGEWTQWRTDHGDILTVVF